MYTKINNSARFSCFSPPVMIATFFIEIFLAIFILSTRTMNTKVRLGVLLLMCLAVFQLAEYSICESYGVHPNIWAKIGFVSITLLPPLGLHLVYTIAKKTSPIAIYGSYALASVWIVAFIVSNVMSGPVCEGNYVIFKFTEPWEGLYYIYYDVLMLAAVLKGTSLAIASKDKKQRSALILLVIGYVSFIIPSVIFSRLVTEGGVDSALPSILCGFAVIFALFLSFGVLPKVSRPK